MISNIMSSTTEEQDILPQNIYDAWCALGLVPDPPRKAMPKFSNPKYQSLRNEEFGLYQTIKYKSWSTVDNLTMDHTREGIDRLLQKHGYEIWGFPGVPSFPTVSPENAFYRRELRYPQDQNR
jgi:hypothetical protein